MAPRFAITAGPLRIESLLTSVEADVRASGEGCGALASFVGVVRGRHKGREVRYLDYEVFEPLAVRVFGQIAAEAEAVWPGVVLAIHHRSGRVDIGEASVAVVAGAAHRDAACRACRYGIERVKQVAPVWKHEFFVDGDEWIEGAVADPSNDAARQDAMHQACA